MHDLSHAPLPWSVQPSTLFESQVVSAPLNEEATVHAVIFQGPREVAEFIVESCNRDSTPIQHGLEELNRA